MLRTCCFLLCLVAVTQQLSITKFAVPSAAEVGSNVELQCQYGLNDDESEKALFVKWWWTPEPVTKRDRIQLYQRIAGRPAESIQHKVEIKENDTIVLLDLKASDSGFYECEVSNIDEARRNQELIVFTQGTGPQLNITRVTDGPDEDDDEDVQLECVAEDVAPIPDFAVSINGETIDVNEVVVGPDEDGLYSISANVTLSDDVVDGAELRCELFYADANISHTPFVDTKTLYLSGAIQSTTENLEDTTELLATSEPLENPSDDSCHIHSSWLLLVVVAALAQMIAN